ncbi:pyruvate kinase [Ureaplasma ceti]|uniref:Pyruvate kinase n=1 Tax=Ureaplasma ceti TaxID=3119530 RepID=A0ABP9U9A7_9BACT
MNLFNKTKLVITLGPSTDKLWTYNRETLTIQDYAQAKANFLAMSEEGVNVMRFNLSHETLPVHEQRLNLIREMNRYAVTPVAVLFDTKGPEIRVNQIQTTNLEMNLIKFNDEVTITCFNPDTLGNGKQFNVSDSTKTYNMAQDLKLKQKIYLDDGKLVLEVKKLDVNQGIIKAVSLSQDYYIKSNKRINLVGTNYSLPFMSDYDRKCIEWTAQVNAEFLALSFVSKVSEVEEVKQLLKATNPDCTTKVIAKIESYEAITNLEEIVQATDGIMVARGDLALEIGFEHVPYYEEQILYLTNKYNKFAIVATQMLDSMETNNLPTRAEVTDCYFAVKLLADATMTSGETASSQDPMNVIKTMKFLTNTAETYNRAHTQKIYTDFKIPAFYEPLMNKLFQLIKNQEMVILKNFSDKELQIISKLNCNCRFLILDKLENLKLNQNLYRDVTLVNEEVWKKHKNFDKNIAIIDQKAI